MVSIVLMWLHSKRQQKYVDQLSDDRDGSYRKHRLGMQFIGATAYITPGDPNQFSVDPFYEIPKYKQRPQPKLSRGQRLAVIATAWAVGFYVYKMPYSADIPSAIVIGYFGAIWLGAVISLRADPKKAPVQTETPLNEAEAAFLRTPWHRYHAKILTELGFQSIALSSATQSRSVSGRQIFLAADRTALVELGVSLGNPLYGIVSLLNDDSFVVTRRTGGQTIDNKQPSAFVLKAGGDDLVQAIDTHAEQVKSMTQTGVLIASLSSANFADALAHGNEIVIFGKLALQNEESQA